MPKFTAPITDDDPLHKPAYALAVEAPWVDPHCPPPWMHAFIVPGIEGCAISEELARQYEPLIEEGDVLRLTLVEQLAEDSEVHRYLLGIPVRFIKSRRRDLIRLSDKHLLSMFDMSLVSPQEHESKGAEFLVLTLRRCVSHRTDAQDENEFAPN